MSSEEKIQQLQRLMTQGRWADVRKHAAQLSEIHANDPQIRAACIEALLKAGDMDSALSLSERSAETGDPASQFQYGRLLRETGQAQQALKPLEQARQAGFEPATEVWLQLALAHADLRDEETAIELLLAVLDKEPGHLLALFNLASLEQARGNKEAAERGFQRVLERDPTFTEALVRLIYGRRMTAEDTGLLRKAERRSRSMLSTPMDQEGLHFALAKAQDDLGDFAAAMSKARVANDLQARRIGAFDPEAFESRTDALIKGVSLEWLDAAICASDFAPIFIVGHFRSGSTLVEQILSAHHSTCSLGELDFFLRRWFENHQRFEGWHGSEDVSELQTLAGAYQTLAESMGADGLRCIDKRPENLLFMGLIRKLFPRARFIHTRRQWLDNAISVYMQQLNDLSQWATTMAGFAAYDRACQKLMTHWQACFGDFIHAVDYEAMVVSPEPTSRALMEFLELEWDPACLDFAARGHFVRTASLAQVREGFHSRSVGRGEHYRPYLTKQELAVLGAG